MRNSIINLFIKGDKKIEKQRDRDRYIKRERKMERLEIE